MCSCFSGTQNALLLSVSGRSSDCKHCALFRKCVVAAGVPVSTFQRRMRLRDEFADFVAHRKYGTAVVWTVLYQTMYSVVMFTAGNVATCVAPGCRRFGGRSGHVKLARPLNMNLKAGEDAEDLDGGSVGPRLAKAGKAAADRAAFIISTEEDEGLEKLPLDTARDKGDSTEGKDLQACPS